MMEELSIKDYIDQLFRHHADIHKKDLNQLEHQAAEYERRLEELNHAHRREQDDKAEFVNRQVHEKEMADLRRQLDKIREDSLEAKNIATANAKDIANMQATLVWLSRTIIGAILVAIVAMLLRGTLLFPMNTVPTIPTVGG